MGFAVSFLVYSTQLFKKKLISRRKAHRMEFKQKSLDPKRTRSDNRPQHRRAASHRPARGHEGPTADSPLTTFTFTSDVSLVMSSPAAKRQRAGVGHKDGAIDVQGKTHRSVC